MTVRDEMLLNLDPARVRREVQSWYPSHEVEVDETVRASLPADLVAEVDQALAGYGRHARAFLVVHQGQHACVEVRHRRKR